MGSEVFRERQYGNFRKPKALQKKTKSTWRQKRPGMSEEHLKAVRALPCCVCGKEPAGTVHHLKDTPERERGMSVRSSDKWGVPLCIHDHDAIERAGSRNEVAWFQREAGFDPRELAMALWGATNEPRKMRQILLAYKGLR
jgi:hypothetical protein